MAQYQPSERAKLLTPYFLHSPSQFQNIASQLDHRLGLVSFWGITPGSRVLEIGCGQGDCTVVLADAVGEAGHVDALDPGSPDYGETHFSIFIPLYSPSEKIYTYIYMKEGNPWTLVRSPDQPSTSPLSSHVQYWRTRRTLYPLPISISHSLHAPWFTHYIPQQQSRHLPQRPLPVRPKVRFCDPLALHLLLRIALNSSLHHNCSQESDSQPMHRGMVSACYDAGIDASCPYRAPVGESGGEEENCCRRKYQDRGLAGANYGSGSCGFLEVAGWGFRKWGV